jgi:SAM-dependent methyltransferase
MPPDITDIFCCPKCRGDLNRDMTLSACRCVRCDSLYAFEEGILNLNPEPTDAALQEMQGHRIIEDQWLDSIPEALREHLVGEAGQRLLFSLPKLPHPELFGVPSLARLSENADDFFELLDWMRVYPGEVIIEIGAHIGWASHHLAQRGAFVFATDISHQLAIANAFEQSGIAMKCVYADMESLPVREGAVNTIFAVAAIHHAQDLSAVFGGCARALCSGGRCVFFSEPVAGRYDTSIKETFGAEEKAVGIQEHIYTIDEYFEAAQQCGLIPSILPLQSVLLETTRRYKLFRSLWRVLLWAKIGYHPLFTRYIYRYMLRYYPRIPFPRLALIFVKR